MIGSIILITIILIIFFIYQRNETCDTFEAGAYTFMLGCILFIVYLILEMFFGLITIQETIGRKEVKQYNISGLENKTTQEFNFEGEYLQAFTIGYGNISGETETEMNYWFFMENEYGKKITSIPCTDVYIREVEENEEYCLIYVVEEYRHKGNKILSWFFKTISEEDFITSEVKEKILQVPYGTVQVEYNVNF